MGFFDDFTSGGWLPTAARIGADIATFGTNELAGNPIGKFASSVVNGPGEDPNAALNAQQMQLARDNMEMQREFAKNGVRWRVEDAVAAGLHPLAALGVNPASASPVSASVFPADTSRRDTALHTLSGMSQDILRARLAKTTTDERLMNDALVTKTMAEADAATAMAEESRRRTALMGVPPPMPTKYRSFMLPDGTTEDMYSSDYSQAVMSDPLGMWASSIKKSLGGPNTHATWGAVSDAARESFNPWRSK